VKYRIFALCGILGSLIYVFTVLLGGIVTPNYSHVSQAISELIAFGSPKKALLDPLFDAYNVLVVLFAVGLYQARNPKRSYVVGTLLLAAAGIVGLIMTLLFPMDPRNAPATVAGQMHILLAGVESVFTIVTVFSMGIAFRGDKKWLGFSNYSLITGVLILITGVLTAISTAQGSSILGLFERATIGLFLLWVFVVAVRLYIIADG
jgi:hypothetical membrane protein